MRYLKNKNIIIILVVYIFAEIILQVKNYSLYININPIFWGIILAYLIYEIKRNYIRFNTDRKHYKYIIIIIVLHVLAYIYLGNTFGFSKSPYKHEIIPILKNAFLMIFPIISIEIARGVFVNRNKNNKLAIAGITVLLILAQINYYLLVNFNLNKEGLFKYICGEILPLTSYNILYTYLVLKSSYLITIIFRVFIKLLLLLLPILADLDWFMLGTFGIILPVVIYILFKYIFNKEKEAKKKYTIFAKISYILTLSLCIILTCFMLGMFKYQAITILSNSMDPIFGPSDVVIYKKLEKNNLQEIQVGDIIIYSVENQNIVHRVVDVIEEDGVIKYQTKGDNNNTPDSKLVDISQIKGIYLFSIKYFGLPSVWLYDIFYN